MRRSFESIVAHIEKIAPYYVPEWKFKRNGNDPGSALALIFAGFMEQTAAKFAAMPEKHKIEFYSLLGAKMLPARPSEGVICFGLADNNMSGSPVPKNFKLFSPPVDENGMRLIFETQEEVFVSPAVVSHMIFTDYKSDTVIFSNSEKPFASAPVAKNLRRFSFTHEYLNRGLYVYFNSSFAPLWDNRATRWNCEIIETEKRFRLLNDNADNIQAEILDITAYELFEPDELCSLSIEAEAWNIPPAVIVSNGEEQLGSEIYPFGKSYTAFDETAFFCDNILSVKNARVTLSFNLDFEITESEIEVLPPKFPKKLIVSKKNLLFSEQVKVSDISVKSVVWEYYNGLGFAPLPLCPHTFAYSKTLAQIKLDFTVPADLSPVIIGAAQGYCIRVRIKEINNALKLPARVFIPRINNIAFSCKAPPLPIEHGEWVNNGIKQTFTSLEQVRFHRPEPREPVLYIGLDKPPGSGIIRILFNCKDNIPNKVHEWQYFGGGRWHGLEIKDTTLGFSQTGVISLMAGGELDEGVLHGKNAYWIRAVFTGNPPTFEIAGVYMNAAQILQCESVLNETYYTDKNSRVNLKHNNLIDEEIWIEDKPAALNQHYRIDRAAGELEFIGEHKKSDSFPIKINCRCTQGGAGNLAAGLEFTPSLAIGFISRAVNPFPILGGVECETPLQTSERTAAYLRHSGRCVTESDYFDLINISEIEKVSPAGITRAELKFITE
ncbi:MAG: hypothetical protein FWE74_08625 [Oscillospiraceae bacterium]|nr:hypothetical protein [Oscillospiraceae bacterium]